MNSLELKLVCLRRGKRTKDMATILGLNDQSWRLKVQGGTPFSIKQVLEVARELELNLEEVNIIFFDGKLPS